MFAVSLAIALTWNVEQGLSHEEDAMNISRNETK